ncbi:MAG: HDOD domain-containing protein, partial [Thioalkalispiraceae bacterium]
MYSKQTSAIDSNSLSAGLALLDDIPPLDNAVQRLIQALSDENISEKQLASIIDQCPSLSGKIVGLANSAYFRRSTPIQNLQDAIRLIGLRTVKSFAIASALQDPFSNSQCPSFRPGHYWLHDVLTAHAARELSKKLPSQHAIHPEQAYLAGLLHNIGLLALAHLFPDNLNSILDEGTANSEILAQKTRHTFGADYLTVGAALLKYWHLPESFVAMAKNYANPDYQGNDWPLCRLINVAREWASHIVHQETSAPFNGHALAQLGISTNHAEATRIKCLEQLEVYTELCEIISGSKAEFYNRDTVNNAAIELKARLNDSIDSLSSIRALTELNIRNKSEQQLLNDALEILMEHQDMQRCSIFLNKESTLVNVSGLSWDEHFTKNDQPSSNTTYTFSLGEGIIGMVAETGKMKHTPDTSIEPLFKQITTENSYVP